MGRLNAKMKAKASDKSNGGKLLSGVVKRKLPKAKPVQSAIKVRDCFKASKRV